jgi:hypothetical protein
MPLALRAAKNSVGNLYAHLFENPRQGVERNVYWSLTVPCSPVRWDDEEHECSVTCEWLVWPSRDWRQLDGATLATVTKPKVIESSFYLADHHPVGLEQLELSRSDIGAQFRVKVAGTFTLEGFDELDGTDMKFSLEGEVDFEGLVVVPGNLMSKPQSESEVLKAVAPYADLVNFDPPIFDGFRYVLRPALSEA